MDSGFPLHIGGELGPGQDQVCVSGVYSFIHEHAHKSGSTYSVSNMSAIVEAVSTEADAGNT